MYTVKENWLSWHRVWNLNNIFLKLKIGFVIKLGFGIEFAIVFEFVIGFEIVFEFGFDIGIRLFRFFQNLTFELVQILSDWKIENK